jgi:hypothetical protein
MYAAEQGIIDEELGMQPVTQRAECPGRAFHGSTNTWLWARALCRLGTRFQNSDDGLRFR